MKIIALPGIIRGLIFDIDQTLYDNREYYDGQKILLVKKLAQVRSRSFEEMLREIDAHQKEYAEKNSGKKLSLGNLFLRLGISLEENSEWRTELFKPENYLSKDEKLIMTMKALSAMYYIAAVSNTSTHVAIRTLVVLGVEEFFPVVIGLDRSLASKPALKPFEMASVELQIPLRHLVSIGDRMEVDLELPVMHGMGGILIESMEDIYSLPGVLIRNKSEE
ncbi:MAG: HAD family hydrolase [Spirochaetales bacterium]|nr:HAD family hydrolase [Spirochaetales bacterium]